MGKAAGLVAALGLWAGAGISAQASLTFTADTVYEGSGPGVPAPWVTAQIEDVSGGVKLTLTAGNLLASEFIGDVGLNSTLINSAHPGISVSLADTDPEQVAKPSTQIGNNVWNNAGGSGGGDFDFHFSFQNSNGSGRFKANEQIVLLLTGGGLTASSFNDRSAVKEGDLGLFITAHIQGIPDKPDDSGWITVGNSPQEGATAVPEPATVVAGMLLLLPFGASTVRVWRSKRAA